MIAYIARPIGASHIGGTVSGAGVERFPHLLAKLGKHKAGKGCLYIKKLDDVHSSVLEELESRSVTWTKGTYSADR